MTWICCYSQGHMIVIGHCSWLAFTTSCSVPQSHDHNLWWVLLVSSKKWQKKCHWLRWICSYNQCKKGHKIRSGYVMTYNDLWQNLVPDVVVGLGLPVWICLKVFINIVNSCFEMIIYYYCMSSKFSIQGERRILKWTV